MCGEILSICLVKTLRENCCAICFDGICTHLFCSAIICLNLLFRIVYSTYPFLAFAILGPNPTLQNNMAGRERPHSQSTSATGRDDGKKKQPTTSRFGSNIHTLKHDEDDGRFNDRNSFWNGNSTQYGGGDNDGK